MIIDDDPDETYIFRNAIETFAPDVECLDFNLPHKALAYLMDEQSIKPNWIFLDLNMPKMDGLTCLKQIKGMLYLNKIPVIMYSTSSQKADIESSKKLGADGYVTKPNTFEEIIKEVKKWIV